MCSLLFSIFCIILIIVIVLLIISIRILKKNNDRIIKDLIEISEEKHNLSNKVMVISSIFETTWGELSNYYPSSESEQNSIDKIKKVIES